MLDPQPAAARATTALAALAVKNAVRLGRPVAFARMISPVLRNEVSHHGFAAGAGRYWSVRASAGIEVREGQDTDGVGDE